MQPADWQRVVALFEAALGVPEGEREALVRASAEETAVQDAALRLLVADRGAGRFLEGPAAPPEGVPAVTASAIPPSIGRYRVADRIGRGGFGDVFRAFDPVLKREVAIKTCLVGDDLDQRRFLREAELAARLHHPNIVTVFDFGRDGAVPYLVQELLAGRDLSERITAGDLPPIRTRLEWLGHVARGLAYAHRAGVVHRDVKPSNLRVLDGGVVKILDFGIARATGSSAMSATGGLMGTVAYMAPEVLRGAAADARSDVFSFGAVAWELLAGRRRLAGSGSASPAAELYEAVARSTPPLARVAPRVPAQAAALVDRCLAADPGERPGDGTALALALEARATPGETRRATALLAALPVALILAGLVAWAIVRNLSRGPAPGVSALAPAPTAALPTGALRLEASPWGRVVDVVDSRGRAVALPAGEGFTPLAIAVEAGTYTARIRHPAFAEPRQCTVRVEPEAGATPLCTVRFVEAGVDDFLAHLGAPP